MCDRSSDPTTYDAPARVLPGECEAPHELDPSAFCIRVDGHDGRHVFGRFTPAPDPAPVDDWDEGDVYRDRVP